jgi:hypothetical protein
MKRKLTATEKATMELPEADRLNVGDAVTHTIHTDANAGHVVKVSKNGRTVWVQAATQELLNGFKSGEADALTFTPGGFCGHTEGTQRWKVTPNPEGHVEKFTARPIQRREFVRDEATGLTKRDANGRMVETLVTEWRWKKAGHPTNSPGNNLRRGARPYYDYNF